MGLFSHCKDICKQSIWKYMYCHHSHIEGATLDWEAGHPSVRFSKGRRPQGRGAHWLIAGGGLDCHVQATLNACHRQFLSTVKSRASLRADKSRSIRRAHRHAFKISGHHEPKVRSEALENPQNYEQWKNLNKGSNTSCYLLLKEK